MNIYDVLRKDHEEIVTILDELVSLRMDDEYRFVLIEELQKHFVTHADAEEVVFYHTLRALDADQKLMNLSYQEHIEIETLMRYLQVMDRQSEEWKDVSRKLKTKIMSHFEKEESIIFTLAQELLRPEEAQSMGDAYIQIKPQIVRDGTFRSPVDMVIHIMPPHLADKIKHLGEKEKWS